MRDWIRIGTLVITALPKIIGLIERIRGSQSGQGAQKRQDVRELILALVEGAEGATGRDLLNDAEVVKAYDAVNDALVAFQNVIAKKAEG